MNIGNLGCLFLCSFFILDASFSQIQSQHSTQKNSNLSLQMAIELAIKKSENLQKAVNEFSKIEAQISEVWSNVYPKISATVKSTRYLESPVIPFMGKTIPLKQEWEGSVGLQLQQVIWNFGRIEKGLEIAKINKELKSKNIAAARKEIVYQTTIAYYHAQLAKQILIIAEESVENAKKNKKALETRFQGGRVPQYDNIKMAADISSRIPVLADATKQLELSRLQLKLLLGWSKDTNFQLTDQMFPKFPELGEVDNLEEVINRGLEVGQAEDSVLLTKKMMELTKAQYLPSIIGFASYDLSGTSDRFSIGSDNLYPTKAIGVMLNIPLWQGGEKSAKLQQQSFDQMNATLSLEQLKRLLVLQLESIREQYRADVKKYHASNDSLQLTLQAYELTRSQYSAGGLTQKELNDVEMMLTGTKIQMQTTLFSIYQSLAQYAKIASP